VSFIAGLLLDKFAYHLPLYRQHQRLDRCGITVSSPVADAAHPAGGAPARADLRRPVRLDRAIRVKAMDETPIKAGAPGPGKMKAATSGRSMASATRSASPSSSRAGKHVEDALGLTPVEGAVLLTDGYAAYSMLRAKTGITHAQCWAHYPPKLLRGADVEPKRAAQALRFIGQLYEVERSSVRRSSRRASGPTAQAQAKPIVDEFFAWVDALRGAGAAAEQPADQGPGLRPRATPGWRSICRPGRADRHQPPRARICAAFRWAAQLAVLLDRTGREARRHRSQSLIVTCRLHQIDPYTYLVDVLQRVGQHPANRVHELTPAVADTNTATTHRTASIRLAHRVPSEHEESAPLDRPAIHLHPDLIFREAHQPCTAGEVAVSRRGPGSARDVGVRWLRLARRRQGKPPPANSP
jgi:transposase